jgi:outer membrane receptor protein involved in Fe transport
MKVIPTSTLSLLLSGAFCHAAEPLAEPTIAGVDLETLVVTGDLWESPLEQVAASVSIFESQIMQSQGTRHFGDLINGIPNLTTTGGTSRPRFFQIRGIGENSQFEGETPDSSVRFVVDDLDFTGLGMVGSTFDVSQVEVLRGPQAGAFGANAAGGLIRMVTNAPTPYWTGTAETSVGENSLWSSGLAVGGPLLQRNPQELMMRMAVEHSQSDGFRRNLTLHEDTNARDEWMARLRTIWNPTADLHVDSTFFYSDQDNGFDEFALDNNGWNTFSDEPGRDEQESLAGSVRATYDGWRGVKFSSVSSLGAVDSLYSYDDDWTAATDPNASYQGFSEVERERTTFNQEFRLDSTSDAKSIGFIDRWTLGAFFSAVDENGFYTNTNPDRIKSLGTEYSSKNLAIFGQAAHDLNETNRIVLGLRTERIEITGSGVAREGGVLESSVDEQYDDILLGGKLTYEHDVHEQVMAFASATLGYKSGGINNDARINIAGGDPLRYDTESLWNYEIGLRSAAFENKLKASLTAFYTMRSNSQVRDSAGLGGDYRYFTDNGDDSEIRGIEAEGIYELGSHWSLHSSLALMGSKIEPFTLNNGNPGGGGRLPNTPSYGYSFGLRYQPAQGFFGNLEFLGKAAYLESISNAEQRSSFDVLNTSIGYRGEQWSLTLWARNLLDERYDKRVFFFANEDPWVAKRYTSAADPRQIGVTARYEF